MVEPLERIQTTAFREREAMRNKINEIIEEGVGGSLTPVEPVYIEDKNIGVRMSSTLDTSSLPVPSSVIKYAVDTEATARSQADSNLASQISDEVVERRNADDGLLEALDGKQDVLVSGTNIRTINGSSLLGPGNIQMVEGGQTALLDVVSFTDWRQRPVFIAGYHMVGYSTIFFSGIALQGPASSIVVDGVGYVYDGTNTTYIHRVTLTENGTTADIVDLTGTGSTVNIDPGSIQIGWLYINSVI